MATNQETEYPIFLGCLEYTNDEYWISIFTDLAKGKMPYGIHITNDNTITTHYKNKEFIYIFKDKEPLDIYETIKNVLISDFGVFSEKDIQENKDNLSLDLTTIEGHRDEDWKKIRRSSIQNFVIHRYSLDFAKRHKKDIDFAKYTKSEITAFIHSKEITSDNITMKNGRIKSINNMTYNSKKNKFTVKDFKSVKPKKDKVVNLSDYWLKMIKK